MKNINTAFSAAIVLAALAVAAACNHSSSSAIVQFSHDESARASEYHKLAAQIKADQAAQSAFLQDWIAICKANKGQALQMDSSGDPACAAPPVQQAPAPPPQPATQPPSNTPVKGK